ncbi:MULTISPECIES: ArsR/SmtB family transcription factor [Acidithiobacillus]|jgi:DNA-binding transcriptional ArsR family regulator|uniref:Transcriptional regulator n=3 Tax=Acidithiobacillus caldus TaxID=33059 RepID=A0A1E7YU67_9PROT|nr:MULTISPECIES: metalloregulator ArsR/SmtB family transcription factor [Acidithiobacillus]AEK57600.1 probable transcriptional regulator, ArsR family [Acidithiobacillus caldus SM-1]AIA54810.1 Transcriptional regulator, ArsR family [Acidithiobacillus caldus ATCC 51756]AUW32298.1 winged helix-turn-helix transcriptional regulator [Acidithiobacillus caldus]MBU2730390.1 winged helix-turn-helix transcriptional regulator [Acidithiobacillus caldus]MBU2735660.1 winged helix-turn-helix transcriptional r
MKEVVLSDREIPRVASAIKAIAHPLRYKIICLLSKGEMSMQNLVKAINTSHSNASQHLAMLQDSGLVLARKVASRVYYRIRDQRTLNLLAVSRSVLP